MALRKRYLLLIPIVVFSVVATTLYQKSHATVYQSASALRGPIIEEVLASGNVESPSATDLHFKASGKLVALNVRRGEKVSAGEVLAREDNSTLSAQLAQANAAVAAAQASLAKLVAGATPQTVAVSEAAIAVAQQSLTNRYGTVESTLLDAYAKSNDAVQNQLAQFFSNTQTTNPQLTFTVRDSALQTTITSTLVSANGELLAWQNENSAISASSSASDLDQELGKVDAHLAVLQSFLTQAVAAVNANAGLTSTVAATYRTSAGAGLTEVNAAVAEVKSLEQSISAGKAAVAQANAQLDLTVHGTTANDISAQTALVEQAKGSVATLASQLHDLELVAPFSGTITDTTGTVGEVVTPTTPVISIIPETALDIKANVAEGNIVPVKPGQPVAIELDAFPMSTVFDGVVSEVDPAETVIGGAIYYRTTILFAKDYQDLRPGMTANVRIMTGSSSDALLIPASALHVSATSTRVLVLEKGQPVEKIITTGLKDLEGRVEVRSGLEENEQVITGTN